MYSFYLRVVSFLLPLCTVNTTLMLTSFVSLFVCALNLTLYRSVSVGPQHYLNGTNTVRVLQVSWHPYSDTHVGVLSSDSVFRYYALITHVVYMELLCSDY